MNKYDKGYISLYRKFKNWRYYTNDNIKSVFIHCLLSACWEDQVITEYNGKPIKPIVLKRGSFITSYRKMAKELNKNVGEIRYALEQLSGQKLQHTNTTHSTTHELTITTTQLYTLIFIDKFEEFQPLINVLQHTENSINNTVNNTQLQQHINKDINKDIKIKRYKDKSAEKRQENINSFTIQLIKKGFIDESEATEVFDEIFEQLLEEYSFNHINVILDYILKKANPNRIRNKYSYLKKALNTNLKKMETLRNSKKEDSDLVDEEFERLFDQLKRGEL